MQKPQPLIWDARIRTSSIRPCSRPLLSILASTAIIAFEPSGAIWKMFIRVLMVFSLKMEPTVPGMISSDLGSVAEHGPGPRQLFVEPAHHRMLRSYRVTPGTLIALSFQGASEERHTAIDAQIDARDEAAGI